MAEQAIENIFIYQKHDETLLSYYRYVLAITVVHILNN